MFENKHLWFHNMYLGFKKGANILIKKWPKVYIYIISSQDIELQCCFTHHNGESIWVYVFVTFFSESELSNKKWWKGKACSRLFKAGYRLVLNWYTAMRAHVNITILLISLGEKVTDFSTFKTIFHMDVIIFFRKTGTKFIQRSSTIFFLLSVNWQNLRKLLLCSLKPRI